jgi:hypothetical protein
MWRAKYVKILVGIFGAFITAVWWLFAKYNIFSELRNGHQHWAKHPEIQVWHLQCLHLSKVAALVTFCKP